MHAQVQSLYSFSPVSVTDEVRATKSKEMDTFWHELTNNKSVELPLLRNELKDAQNPPFFFEDGSSLLLSLSQSSEDELLAAASLSRVDLKDVQARAFLFEVHSLAMKGVDSTPAAFRMLEDPKFKVYLPEHAYMLDQASCLLVALLPLPTDVWLPAVIKRVHAEKDVIAQKTLLLLLFYAQTDEADRLLQAAATDSSATKEVREFAAMVVKHEHELGVGKQPSHPTETRLREDRRKRMFAVSDEAMDDMNDLTSTIARARSLRSSAP